MNNSSASKNEEWLQKKREIFLIFFLEIFSYKKIITDIGENWTHY